MGKVMLEGFQCERCKHMWIPRSKDETPTICPKCKSPYWNKPRKMSTDQAREAIKLNSKRREND